MSELPYEDWRNAAAREIVEGLRAQRELQAYYDSGGGDGWARSYGGCIARYPDFAAIINRHYTAMLNATKS